MPARGGDRKRKAAARVAPTGGLAILYGVFAGDDLAVSALILIGKAASPLISSPILAERGGVAHGGEGLAGIGEAHRDVEGNSRVCKIVVTVD